MRRLIYSIEPDMNILFYMENCKTWRACTARVDVHTLFSFGHHRTGIIVVKYSDKINHEDSPDDGVMASWCHPPPPDHSLLLYITKK